MAFEKALLLPGDQGLGADLESWLRERYETEVAITPAQAVDRLGAGRFDFVVAEANPTGGPAFDFLKQFPAGAAVPLVIVISAPETEEAAAQCLDQGATAWLPTPVSHLHLEAVLRKAEAHSRLLRLNQHLHRAGISDPTPELAGHSPLMDQLRTLIRKVARTHATVLIQGESGAGKERVARAIVEQSPRAGAAVLTVDCAALPESLLEARLFGASAATASGAAEREGALELAQGGTVVLKEAGLIPPALQAILLRVLQKQEIELAGRQPLPVDVRILALTNRRLEEMVKRNEFREDLFLALNIVPVVVPPLRERSEDILELAEHFRLAASRRYGRETLPISGALARVLQVYSWPGNVRELENAVTHAVLLSEPGGALQPEQLGLENTGRAPESSAAETEEGEADSLATMEKKHIFAILEKCGGNRTHAAGRLGISIRTLRNKLREYKAGDPAADAPPEVG